MKKVFIIFIACILICLGVFFIFGVKSVPHQTEQKHPPLLLPTHVLENQSFTYTKSFIGSVEAIQSVMVVPYLAGFLKQVRVHPGEEVKEGDVLFLLDERISLADLNQAKEATSQTYATRENAKIYYERMQNTNVKAVSPTDLEQAKTEFEASDAAYQKALAAQNQAQTLYDYTIIQAPISGWLGNITATVGEYLSPESKALATIIHFSPIRLSFSVPMSAYNGLFSVENATLQVVLANGKALEFDQFKIIRNNQADKSTDSLSFFVDIPNDEKFLMPGAYVEVRFLYHENGILVNKNWITLTPDGAEVTLLKNGLVEKQKVQIGAPVGNQYWIKSGLSAGDNIITVSVSPFQIGQPAEGVPQ
ncbi:MAG: efflux RND transporter periplasmic adaptor subunit [Alphaproteobacteria bacterium]|nr:efflux RND transporter periplasmic adaptor subunit [Alphaproteobacteria bacterium]